MCSVVRTFERKKKIESRNFREKFGVAAQITNYSLRPTDGNVLSAIQERKEII